MANLTLLDTRVPAASGDAPSAHDDELDHVFLGGRRASELVAAADLAGLSPEQRLALLVERAHDLGLLPSDIGVDQARRLLAVLGANQRARQRYRPRPYAGDVTLLQAADQSFLGLEAPAAGWRPLVVGELRVHEIPGNHFSLLERPAVEKLAATLESLLTPARRRDRPVKMR